MSEILTVKLAGKSFEVKPLTLAQLRELAIGVVEPDPADQQELVGRSFDRAVARIALALKTDHPDMTTEKLYAMSITRDELRAAADAVLQFSGLIPKPAAESPPSGEAGAGAA